MSTHTPHPVESSRGVKDPELMRAFADAVRGIGRAGT